MNKVTYILIISIFLSACAASEDAGPVTELEGSWKTTCNYDADNNEYSIEETSYSGSSFSANVDVYDDSECTLSAYTLYVDAKFSIGDSKVLTSGIEVKEIDFTNIQWEIALINGTYIKSYNASSVCGISSWEINKRVNVTSCLELSSHIYDIFKVDGSTFFYGDDDFGDYSSDENRPTQLDAITYTRI
jgi:hypothetical protein